MSLIQDALKRKLEEPPQAVTPPTSEIPAEAVPPAGEPAAQKSPQPLMIVLIVLLIIALLVALGGLAVSLIRPSAPESRPAEAPAVEAPAPVAAEPESVPPDPVTPAPAVSTPEPAAPATVQLTEAEHPVQGNWPELKLTGIASSDSQRIAIINGKMLTDGRVIGEVLIVKVLDTEAILEFHGERRVLHVNE